MEKWKKVVKQGWDVSINSSVYNLPYISFFIVQVLWKNVGGIVY